MSEYKQGDIVRSCGAKMVIVADHPVNKGGYYGLYLPNDKLTVNQKLSVQFIHPDDIDGPWREPLRAEFETEWSEAVLDSGARIIMPGSSGPGGLYQFVGKRTRVTVEEIL